MAFSYLEKQVFKQDYQIVAGIDEAGRGCEKIDAEVLTNNGWKFYADINLKDKVLSYTNDGYIKWQKIEKIIEKDFEGNLIELKNRGIDIVVTPDHWFTVIRRVFKRDKKDNHRLKLVGYKTRKKRKIITDLSDNDFIPRGGKWKGINKKLFKLPRVDRDKEKLIDIKLWVAFLGIFLSEGSISYYKKKGMYRINISQNENAPKNRYKKIYCLLKQLPFRFNKFKTGFKCYSKQLYTYLKQFGNCYNKFIPRDIKELPPELLNILINWMILGDGTCYTNKGRKEVCVYYTVSQKLKDDFEEILLKAGWTYHTTARMPRDSFMRGRMIRKENQVPCFEIRLRRSNKAIVKHLHKKRLFYKGKIFCLQLPKYHNFYVRRNGTGYFTGNSLAGPVVAAAVAVKRGSSFRIKDVKDSKQLSSKKREEIFETIKNNPHIEWRVSFVWPKVIDRINIWQATLLAWQRSLKKLSPQPDFLFLDGKMGMPRLKIAQRPIIKGDQKIALLSLASIVAKVSRDRLMKKLDKKFSQHGFAQHKGYGTKLHFERLARFGPCLIHRRSFRPVFANLPFVEKVYYIVSQIPRGQVMNYRQVAQKIGQPRAYRAVGNALNKNRSRQVPCHRVIRSDGQIGGFQRGTQLKEKLLRKERTLGKALA